MWTTRASRAAAYIWRTSPALSPSGFSHMMCLPARAAAWAIGRWVKLGVAMITASTSACEQIASGSVLVMSTPQSVLRLANSSALVSQAATNSARGIEPDTRHVVIVAYGPGTNDADADGTGSFRGVHVGSLRWLADSDDESTR